MLIVDSHLDIAHNALEWNRDLLRPIAGIREAEAGMTQKGRGLNIVAPDQVPEWWDEGLRIVSLCHYGVSAYSHGTKAPGGLRKIPAILERRGYSQAAVADVMHENWVRLLRTVWR